jgi:localization factor PodJL
MTVGEWLNHVILSAGDDNTEAGEIEGLGVREIAFAIEHISRRIARAEERSAETAETLARSLGGAVERLQRLERSKAAGDTPDDIVRRVGALEEKASDRQRIEALRALEKAVAQVAIQFDSAHKTSVARIAETERQLAALDARIEAAPEAGAQPIAFLKEAVEQLSERVARAEALAAEAAEQAQAAPAENFEPDFVEKTGMRLRILGDEIKRGSDRMRALEGSISRLVEQIDAAERRSAEGVAKVSETISDLRRQFSEADNAESETARVEFEAAVASISERTENRIEALQRSFDEMVRRLEHAGGLAAEPAARAAAAVAEPAPARPAAAFAAQQPEISVALDDASIFDDDIDEAFAKIDLDEERTASRPAPAPSTPAPSSQAAAKPAQAKSDFDDFDLDFDDPAEDAEPLPSDTDSVINEVRAAFGFAPDNANASRDAAEEAFGDIGLDDDEDDESPPVIFGRKSKLQEAPADSIISAAAGSSAPDDFLKRARIAAREAAAREAEEAEKPDGSKRQLTPRQRAVLAARLKRKRLDEAAKSAAPSAVPTREPALEDAPPEEPPAADSGVKAKVLAAIARLKSRRLPGKPEAGDDESETQPVGKTGLRSRVVGKSDSPRSIAVSGLKSRPAAAGLGAAILVALFALVFLAKDFLFGGRRATPDAALQETASPAAAAPEAVATTRPRELYLESYAALKSAETDADERAALKGIEEAAALGHPPAQLQVGEFYKIGQGFEKDPTRARQWYERAANGGNVLAMHRLGVMSARGEGGPVDPAASVAWFEKAARLGLVDSQYNLGASYHPTGDGANAVQDKSKAYFWYSVAARNGDAQAGTLAAGVADGRNGLNASEKAALDAEVAAFVPGAPDPIANEISPAS